MKQKSILESLKESEPMRKRIILLRESAGLTQGEAATILGLKQSGYGKKETGQSDFSVEEIKKLSAYYEKHNPLDHPIDCHWILTGCQRINATVQSETGLSDKAIQAIRHCGEIPLADGYYDISQGIAKGLLNLLLESQEFRDIMHQLYSCYAAFASVENPESNRTGADIIEMENCAKDVGLVILNNNQAAEFYASVAADRLKQFAKKQIADLVDSQEDAEEEKG